MDKEQEREVRKMREREREIFSNNSSQTRLLTLAHTQNLTPIAESNTHKTDVAIA